MTTTADRRIAEALDALPHRFRGPGGVAGVVREGEVIAARAWGHADVVAGRAMTRQTRMPICSISKQFTCGVLLATLDPDALDDRVAAYLPDFAGELPRLRELCDNQSGLRDYWALTVVQGAQAEQVFARDDALPLIARMKTGHFAPGTRYSYCNCNFRILSEIIEAETGEALEDLYRRHIWEPAGMTGAVLTSDTRQPADAVVGHEGSDATGYLPAENAIFWIGDAGISASLDDMMAYEAWIDRTRDDPDGLYRRLSAPPAFRDGTPARYGFGLAHETVGGVATTGHGGALRGFRAHRLHAADARLSVFVAFNHEGDAHAAAVQVLEAALGHAASEPGAVGDDWDGQWLCPETGLLTRLRTERRGAKLHFATGPDSLSPEGGTLGSGGVTVARDGAALVMTRAQDNLSVTMPPLPVVALADGRAIAGRYDCAELGASMEIEARDGGVHVRFDGMLGQGRWERVHPAGPDVWTVATRRSMDAPAPGDWTLQVRRDADGTVTGATLGCWLARGLDYVRA